MKKSDIRKLKVIILDNAEEEYTVPKGYQLIKEPTKISENGVEVFKAVIGSA